ncbi:MAG: hypothetical protein JO052_06785 [Bradyrhizobium sp.]|nr:hypothetical protein [Bradyrhizobium sp.]
MTTHRDQAHRLATTSAALRLSRDLNLRERCDALSADAGFLPTLNGLRLQTMNAMPEECLRIDRSRRPSHSLPTDTIPPAQVIARVDGFPPPDTPSDRATARNSTCGRLIMIAFVAAAPVVVGAWLWLLGRVALALL